MFPLVVHQPAYLASSAVTLAGSVHKSRGDNVDAVEAMMCVVCVDVTEGIVVMDVFWRRLCVSMIWGREICLL